MASVSNMRSKNHLRCFHILLVLTMTSSIQVAAQNFDALTSRIFFNLNLKSPDSILLAEVRFLPGVVMEKNDGWTSYPPTINPDSIPAIQFFSFSHHPYFLSDFSNGYMEVYTSRQSGKLKGLSLSLSFKSISTFDSVYKNITSLYRKYSSRVIKRPNISRPYEEKKYLSANGKDHVIISEGKSENEAHIYIFYNYQLIEW